MSFTDKSSENYAIAIHAFGKNKYNVAASRFYYSIYQGCVNAHVKNERAVRDYMSSDEIESRKDALKSHTNAPKWPHDVLVRHESLNDVGLASMEVRTVQQLKRLRVTGDYGDMDKVKRGDIEPLIACISDILGKKLNVFIERDYNE